nr:hypothetical protein [Streptomyces sp. 846.5]
MVKTELEIEIRAMGRIWAYGATADRFFYPMPCVAASGRGRVWQ